MSAAYDMLVNFKNPNQALQMQNQDTGITFALAGRMPRTPTTRLPICIHISSVTMVVVGVVDMGDAMADMVEDVADEVDALECHMQSMSKNTVMMTIRTQIT